VRKVAWLLMASAMTVGILAAASGQSALGATAISPRSVLVAGNTSVTASSALSGGPALASTGTGQVELFSLAANGSLEERDFASGDWGKVKSLGGDWTAGPAAAADGSGLLVVVVGTADGADYLRSRAGASWSRWFRLPGRGASRPAITASGTGVFSIARRNGDSTVSIGTWHVKSGVFSGWSDLGGQSVSAPAVAATGKGGLTVTALGDGGRLQELELSPSGTHSGWTDLGGHWTGTPALAANPLSGEQYQAVVDMDGVIHLRARAGLAAAWGRWQTLSGSWPASPALISPVGGPTLLIVQRYGASYQSLLTAGHWPSLTKVISLAVPKTTEVLHPGQVTAVTGSPSGTRTITLADGTQAPSPGTILAAGVTTATPDGLLVKVTATRTGPDGTTLVTAVPALLTQAIPDGSINLSADLSAADIASSGRSSSQVLTPDQVARQTAGPAEPALQNISKNLSCGGSASASVTGSVSVSPSFHLTAKWGLFRLRQASFTGTVTEKTQLSASIAGAASCTLTRTPLLDRPVVFQPISFTVGPVPVVIVPELQLYVAASGKVAAHVTDQASQQASATAGLSWANGKLTPIASHSSSFSGLGPPPAGQFAADLSASAGPGLSFLMYGIEGPQLTASASVALQVAPAATPWWKLTGAFDAGAILKLPALHLDKSDDHIIQFQKVLAQAPTSSPPPTASGALLGIAATSSSNAWAVGRGYSGTGNLGTLIEHWNGTAWQRVSSPSPSNDSGFYGVAATSSSNAWAVGAAGENSTSKALIEHWNGSAWKQVASPSPQGAVFTGVAASSGSNAWAVGYYEGSESQEPLIERWNGSAWQQMPIATWPTGGFLTGVTAISAGDAWAVGGTSTGQSVIEHWNGAIWTQVPNPVSHAVGFNAVTATSASNVWALGEVDGDQFLVEDWNGEAWKPTPMPKIAGTYEFYAVTATSPSNVWAVGASDDGNTLVEHWNGTTWEQITTPNPGLGYDKLFGVTATSASNAWAVGVVGDGTRNPKAVILHWNGQAWQ
jgi:hypothetical protein